MSSLHRALSCGHHAKACVGGQSSCGQSAHGLWQALRGRMAFLQVPSPVRSPALVQRQRPGKRKVSVTKMMMTYSCVLCTDSLTGSGPYSRFRLDRRGGDSIHLLEANDMSPPLSSGFYTPVHHSTSPGYSCCPLGAQTKWGQEGVKGGKSETAYFIQPPPLTPSTGMNHAVFSYSPIGTVHHPFVLLFPREQGPACESSVAPSEKMLGSPGAQGWRERRRHVGCRRLRAGTLTPDHGIGCPSEEDVMRAPYKTGKHRGPK